VRGPRARRARLPRRWGHVVRAVVAAALAGAAQVVSLASPLGGVLLRWAGRLALEIYDLETNGRGVDAAQLAGDRAVDLVADLKFGPRP